jgi:hypothetical protein
VGGNIWEFKIAEVAVSWITCFGEYFAGWGSRHMQS